MKIIWCMIPEVWSAPDRIFLLSWTIFCPFTAQKMKKSLEISSFYTSAPKIMIICYTVPEIWYMTDVILTFHFGLFFALLPPPPPNSPKNQIFKKMKKTLKISSFYTGVPKIMIRWCTIPEIWCTTDGWPDAQEKWHVEVGAPPKNNLKEI